MSDNKNSSNKESSNKLQGLVIGHASLFNQAKPDFSTLNDGREMSGCIIESVTPHSKLTDFDKNMLLQLGKTVKFGQESNNTDKPGAPGV